MQPPRISHALRASLKHPTGKAVARQATGWDNSQISRVLSGSQGIVIDKLDPLFESVGFVLVSREYLRAVTTLGRLGLDSVAIDANRERAK